MTGTKRKSPISKREFLAFIKARLVTCAALEADTTTPRKALFKRGEELLADVVRETAAYTERNNMRFSPVNLPKGARWGKYGLTAPFIIVLGHFETSSLNLLGVLLAARSKKKDGLRAPVWNLLDRYVGAGILAASTVVANVCPFTAGHNEGKTLYDDIPDRAQDLMHRLRVVTLNALGNPKKVGGFGGGVRKWIKKRLRPHPRELWTNFKGEIDDACVHLCLFTSVTKRNFVRAKWFDQFDHLVRFISGKRGAGEKLKRLLTKKGKFDEALAKRMEEDHRKLCKANAALYGFGGKYETQKQKDTRASNRAKIGTRVGKIGLNVPPGAKCRVCGCDIGTGRALTLLTGDHVVQPRGSYRCTGKCNKYIAFNMDQLKVMLKPCNKHKRLKGGVRGFMNSFVELWHKKKKKELKGKRKKK